MKSILYSIRVLHGRLHEWRINRAPLIVERLKNPKAVYLVMTPEHGNLGDQAIAQSEKELLHELNISFIEITDRKARTMRQVNCLNVMNGRTILIHGGGNMGMLWPNVDKLMQEVVENNPDSKILMMPNTIYYENSSEGLQELEKSKVVYNSHKKLKIFAREQISYQTMKDLYQDVTLVPDMVLRMNKCQTGIVRAGCILCLRSDCEKTRTDEQEQELRRQAKELFGNNVVERDMRLVKTIQVKDRDMALEDQYNAFRHAELVITDRLHGMVFSAITGTPCIVIDSKSPKVRGCYEWIKHLEYIQFCDDVTRIAEIYKGIEKKEYKYTNDDLLPYYEVLKNDLCLATRRK